MCSWSRDSSSLGRFPGKVNSYLEIGQPKKVTASIQTMRLPSAFLPEPLAVDGSHEESISPCGCRKTSICLLRPSCLEEILDATAIIGLSIMSSVQGKGAFTSELGKVLAESCWAANPNCS